MCHPRCGTLLHFKDDRVVKVTGDLDHPVTQGTSGTYYSEDIDPQMVDLQHGWWFPERDGKLPELFGVFESNANVLCPDGPEFCSPEIGSWPHSALFCRVEKE